MKIKATINVHHHHDGSGAAHEAILQKLDQLLAQGEMLMATQAELTAQVNAVTAQLNKLGTETSILITKVNELTEIIANGPPVTAELQAAVDAAIAQAKVVDDLVPDQP